MNESSTMAACLAVFYDIAHLEQLAYTIQKCFMVGLELKSSNQCLSEVIFFVFGNLKVCEW